MSVRETFDYIEEIPVARPPSDTREAPGWWETAKASFDLTADEVPGAVVRGRTDAYKAIRDALPPDARWRIITAQGGLDSYRQPIRALIWKEAMAARARDPKAFKSLPATQADYDNQVLAKAKADRMRDRDRVERGSGVAGFVGGAAATMALDPINIGSMLMTGGASGVVRIAAREAAINAGIEAVELPFVASARATYGEELTADEMLMRVGMGAAGGAVIGGGGAWLADKLAKRAALQSLPDAALAKAVGDAIPDAVRSPEVADALHVVKRSGEVDATSPYTPTYEGLDAHSAKLAEATARLNGAPAPRAAPAAPSASGGVAAELAAFKRAIGRAESPNDWAKNPNSSAQGRYQFVDSTWLSTYRKVYGATGETQAQILAKKTSGDVQERLMDRLMADNMAVLNRIGAPITRENLYIMHFAGEGGGAKLIRAGNDTPVVAVLGEAVVNANPFLRGMTAAQARAELGRRVGGKGDGAGGGAGWGGVDLGDDAPILRPAALDAVRPMVVSEGRRIEIASYAPSEIGVDAALMQFKSGGDAQGVTERLQGITEWDPMAAGLVTVWQGKDGRLLIADGHQRLGLATRLKAANPDADIRLYANVLREADGITAQDARILTAFKNIGEGRGTMADAAKVFRDGGAEWVDKMARRLPPKSALVRDGKALARLSPEAFGAVVNEVVPEGYAAAIGHYAPDPATHMGLIDLLAEAQPANRFEAETMVRQALRDGFVTETQEELFGGRVKAIAIYAHRARVLSKAVAELRKIKGVFKTAAGNADTLESAGSRIARDQSAAEAQATANSLDILVRLANSRGHVSDLLQAAAERVAKGEKLSSVVRDFVADARKLDLDALSRADGDADGLGRGADGSGRTSEPDAGDGPTSEGLTPSERDELEAAGQGGFALFDEPALAKYDDPQGAGAAALTDSIEHDVRMIAAADPDRMVEDVDGKAMRLADFLDDLDSEARAIDTMDACMRPAAPDAGGAA